MLFKTREVIIYMHGITPDPEPDIHKRNYDSFEKLLKKHLGPKRYPELRVDLEWGFDSQQARAAKTMDRILAPAEQAMSKMIEEISQGNRDYTLNPLRILLYRKLRENFITGLTDMFYYVSEDGKEQVRLNVFRTLLNHLPQLPENEKYSLTIISHSAGAVIMHDLLFILFGGSSKSFLREDEMTRLDALKTYAQDGRLCIRCFVTMGAPIAPMVVRSNKLLNLFYNNDNFDGKIDLSGIGIRKKDKSRWLNFWDKDDVLSCPIRFLYNDPDNLLDDCYVDIGSWFPLVHGKYWTSDSVAKIIAGRY